MNFATFSITSIGILVVGSSLLIAPTGRSQNLYNDLPQPTELKIAQNISIDYTNAPNYIGKEVLVTGTIVKVFVSKTNTTFLNYCDNFRACPLSAVVFAPDRGKFGDLQKLEGKTVKLSGTIKSFQGRPQMILKNPNQIK